MRIRATGSEPWRASCRMRSARSWPAHMRVRWRSRNGTGSERILGPHRGIYINHRQPHVEHDDAGARRAVFQRKLDQLTRAQTNLIRQLESYEPTGDGAIDAEWRTALQGRFAQITTEHRAIRQQLASLDAQDRNEPCDAALLDLLPVAAIDPTLVPEADQRELYDAFHLQVCYDRVAHQITLQVTIHAEAVPALTRTVHALEDGERPKIDNQTSAGTVGPALSLFGRAPGGSRTHTGGGLSSVPLPIGLRGHLGAPRLPTTLRTATTASGMSPTDSVGGRNRWPRRRRASSAGGC
jgi:hypothetical protein